MLVWLIMIALASSAVPALAQPPFNDRYEYAIREYSGIEPNDADKTHWNCWDDKAKMSINCTFIRGSLSKFRYVYRDKGTSGPDEKDPCTLADMMAGINDYSISKEYVHDKELNSCEYEEFWRHISFL